MKTQEIDPQARRIILGLSKLEGRQRRIVLLIIDLLLELQEPTDLERQAKDQFYEMFSSGISYADAIERMNQIKQSKT